MLPKPTLFPGLSYFPFIRQCPSFFTVISPAVWTGAWGQYKQLDLLMSSLTQ